MYTLKKKSNYWENKIEKRLTYIALTYYDDFLTLKSTVIYTFSDLNLDLIDQIIVSTQKTFHDGAQ